MRTIDSNYDQRIAAATTAVMNALRREYGSLLCLYSTGVVEVDNIDISDLIRPDADPADVVFAVEERIDERLRRDRGLK